MNSLKTLETLHKEIYPELSYAGQFRTPVPYGKAWFAFKPVPLFGNEPIAKVFFSPMTQKWLQRLENLCNDFIEYNPETYEEIIKQCIDFYIKFNYIHPFYDGNGRILHSLISSKLRRFDQVLTLDNVDLSISLISIGLATNDMAKKAILTDMDQGIEPVIPLIDQTRQILTQLPFNLNFNNIFRQYLITIPPPSDTPAINFRP